MPARVAGACGLLAFVTATVGWAAGGFAQPAAYNPASAIGAGAATRAGTVVFFLWIAFVGAWLLREPAPAAAAATPPPARPATP